MILLNIILEELELRKEKDNSLIEKLHENAYKIDEKSDKLCSGYKYLRLSLCTWFK